jgi:subtilisin family serine protease
MDTGIKSDHKHFRGTTIVDSYDWAGNDNDPEWEGNSHGTLVAGVIAGDGIREKVDHTDVPVWGVAHDATLVIGREGT